MEGLFQASAFSTDSLSSPSKLFPVKELLICVVALLLSIKFYYGYILQKRKREGGTIIPRSGTNSLPGPWTIPIVGFPIEAFFTDFLSLLVRWAIKYGPCFQVNLLNQKYNFLNSPAYVQKLLMSNDFGHFRKADIELQLFPEGVGSIIVFTGEEWRKRKKMLSRCFTYRALRNSNECFNRHMGKLVRDLGLRVGKIQHISELVSKTIVMTTSESLMGVDISIMEGSVGEMFAESMEQIVHLTFEFVEKPWMIIRPLFRLLRGGHYNKHMATAQAITQMIIDQYKIKMNEEAKDCLRETCPENDNKELPENGKNKFDGDDDSSDADSGSGCMIQEMMKNGCDGEQITHEVACILGVAMDTTAITLENVLFLLASNQEHQKLCQLEVDGIFEDDSKFQNDILDYDALREMKNLERCIHETLRMYPVGSFARKLESPLRLDDELTLRAGENVAFIMQMFHHNPKYFPEPTKFDPARFLPEEIKKRDPCTYVPFSAGPRVCLGMKMALLELKIAVAKILREYDVFTPDRQEDVKMVLVGTVRPQKPINFVFKKRR